MANFFAPGSQIPGMQGPRLNFNGHNTDYSDVSSLSISLANACLSPPHNATNPAQRMAQGRSGTSGFPLGQNFSSNGPLFINNFLGESSSLLSHLPNRSGPINASTVDPKPRDLSQNELMKSAFLSNIFSNKGNPQIGHKLSGLSNRQLSMQRSVIGSDNFASLSSGLATSRPTKISESPGHVSQMPSRHISGDVFPSSNTMHMHSIFPADIGEVKSSKLGQQSPADDLTWLINPPAPEGVGDYLRTGRAHEIKAKASSDRAPTATYMDQTLRLSLRNKLRACLLIPNEDSKFPRTLGAYTLVTPIESSSQPRFSDGLGFPSQCFKAWSPRLSCPVLLRRVVLPGPVGVDGVTLGSDHRLSRECFFLARQICNVEHPSLVRLRDVMPVDDFGDNSVVFVYDFLPCSSTLQQLHMNDSSKTASNDFSSLNLLPEKTSWMYLVQLTQVLRYVHQRDICSIGSLHPSKILVEDGTRLYINCFGIKDILNPLLKSNESKAMDFVSLGKLMLGVICGANSALQNSAVFLHVVSKTYSPGLTNLLRDLLTGKVISVEPLIQATAPYAFDHITSLYATADFTERQLLREMECGRLFRLICKLNSVVERNDLKRPDQSTPEWSETGDRYLLKLFRDFVFHQVDQCGAAHLDLAHIVNALNKVEAGSPERICLVSRDGQRVIIASFKEIRLWLDASFTSLVEEHRRSLFEQQMAAQQQQQTAFLDNQEHQPLPQYQQTPSPAGTGLEMGPNGPALSII